MFGSIRTRPSHSDKSSKMDSIPLQERIDPMIGALLVTATLLAQTPSTGVASLERQRELLAQIHAKVAREATAKAKEAPVPATAPAARAEAETEEAPQRTTPRATSLTSAGTARTPMAAGSPYGYTATGIPTHEGPRGGIYHYSKNGNKVYEKQGSVGRIPSSTFSGGSSSRSSLGGSSRSTFGGSNRSSSGFSSGGSRGFGGGGHR
jgi:hypothetical protein